MKLEQVVMELGGYGAVLPMIGGLFSWATGGYRQATLDNIEANRDDSKLEDKQVLQKLRLLEQSAIGKQVVYMIVFTALAALSAGIWVPFVAMYFHYWYMVMGFDPPTIAVAWYWPTNGSFLMFDWNKLKEFYVGPKGATYVIVIIPTFIAMASNAVSFFMMNRVRKKLFG